jgi:hypothetical protein|tara:strand:- start:2032 stop:2352 length:321 start_codon:yes stop_codon:yes gene_type:complete
MAKLASGKRAKAISDRSGFEVDYTKLVTTWDGLRVEPEEWDPKHPQLDPSKNISDYFILKNPRSDNDAEPVTFFVGYNYDISTPRNQLKIGISATGSIGTFTVVVS